MLVACSQTLALTTSAYSSLTSNHTSDLYLRAFSGWLRSVTSGIIPWHFESAMCQTETVTSRSWCVNTPVPWGALLHWFSEFPSEAVLQSPAVVMRLVTYHSLRAFPSLSYFSLIGISWARLPNKQLVLQSLVASDGRSSKTEALGTSTWGGLKKS